MRNEVYNCDCIEYMRSLPDQYFDVAVCDPPYGSANSEEFIGGGEDSISEDSTDTFAKRNRFVGKWSKRYYWNYPPPKIGADSREGGGNDITNQSLPRRYLGNTIQTLIGGGRRN